MNTTSPSSSRHTFDRRARITVGLLFSVWLVDFADRQLINYALPAIGKEFSLDLAQQGMVISAFFLAYAFMQIPGGMLADRFGAKRVTLWALLAWSAFTAVTGLAWGFAAMIVIRLLFGLAQGVFPGAAMKAVTERTTVGQRMNANGIMQSATVVGAVLAAVLGAPLISAIGWRSTFYAVAGLGVFVYAAVRLWMPAPREDQAPSGPAGGTSWAAARAGAATMLRSGVMWRFFGMYFGYDLMAWGLFAWVPSYLVDQRGVSLNTAGLLSAIPALVAAVTVIIGGRLADSLGGRHRLVIVPGMAATTVFLMLMADASSVTLFTVWMALAAAAAGLCAMPIFSVPLKSLPAELTGVGGGMIIFGGQLAGVVAPTAMGVIAGAFSFQVAFQFLAVGSVMTAVLAVLTPQNTASFLAALRLPAADRPEALAGDLRKESA